MGLVWKPCWPRGVHTPSGELSEPARTHVDEHGARQARALELWPWQGFFEIVLRTGALSGRPLAQRSTRLAACIAHIRCLPDI